jgi:hypothetical protein
MMCRLPVHFFKTVRIDLTSKMSRGGRWRDSGESQNRDSYRSWLHRMVRPGGLSLVRFHRCLSAIVLVVTVAGVRFCNASYARSEDRMRRGEPGAKRSARSEHMRSSRGGVVLNASRYIVCRTQEARFCAAPNERTRRQVLHDCSDRLTSKMRHGGRWRGSGVSQNRDSYRNCLHRLVRLIFHF